MLLRGVQIKNCRDGIDIDDSWSFSLIGNVLNTFSGDGIKFSTEMVLPVEVDSI